MGLRGSIRASFNTISIIEHRSLNAIARGRIPNKIQHGHRPPFLCNRICYGAWTVVPLYADCLLRCAYRTLTGSWRRRVTVTPSRRRWKRGKRASVRGTSVRPRLRHIVCLERVPIIPLIIRLRLRRGLSSIQYIELSRQSQSVPYVDLYTGFL